MTINLLLTLEQGAKIPKRSTEGSAGFDLSAYEDTIIYNHSLADCIRVRTGISCEIPNGYVGLLIERSSLHTRGLSLANNIGVIDSDYRGEILIPLVSTSTMVKVKKGSRLAQLVILALPEIELVTVRKLNESGRSAGRFGSTGD